MQCRLVCRLCVNCAPPRLRPHVVARRLSRSLARSVLNRALSLLLMPLNRLLLRVPCVKKRLVRVVLLPVVVVVVAVAEIVTMAEAVVVVAAAVASDAIGDKRWQNCV